MMLDTPFSALDILATVHVTPVTFTSNVGQNVPYLRGKPMAKNVCKVLVKTH